MLTITKRMSDFSASHTLTAHLGGCANLHGHNYGVEVTLIGPYQTADDANPSGGMIMDFGDIKDIYNKYVHSLIDHATIIGTREPLWYQTFAELFEEKGNGPTASRDIVDGLLGKVAHLPIPETTAEYFAKWIFDTMSEYIKPYLKQSEPWRANEIMIYAVTVWETSTSEATYVNPVLSPGLSNRFQFMVAKQEADA